MLRTVSFIIPTFNSRRVVEAAIESAFSQNGISPQVIVVDDGSTDGTVDVLKTSPSWTRIHYMQKQNGGVASARNLGLSEASGEFICFLDSDDILEPGFCLELLRVLNEQACRVGFCSSVFVDEFDPTRVVEYRKSRPRHGDVSVEILKENFLLTPTVLVERSALCGMQFHVELRYNEDWVYWAELLQRERLAYSDQKLVRVRTCENGLSRQTELHRSNYVLALLKVESMMVKVPGLGKEDAARIHVFHASRLLAMGLRKEAKLRLRFAKDRSSKVPTVHYHLRWVATTLRLLPVFRWLRSLVAARGRSQS